MGVITPLQPICELASRVSDGIEVTMLWHRRSDDLTIRVSDTRTGVEFELVAGRNNALDIFHHPFAYAAARGIPYDQAHAPFASAGQSPQLAA
jgi:hypothetical protein